MEVDRRGKKQKGLDKQRCDATEPSKKKKNSQILTEFFGRNDKIDINCKTAAVGLLCFCLKLFHPDQSTKNEFNRAHRQKIVGSSIEWI